MSTELVRGSIREAVTAADAALLRQAGVLIDDTRRERPRWFDGRFLAARDLIREQQYFLTREADLGRAAGSGVAAGLGVSEGQGLQSLRIEAGHGITPSGELVLLEKPLSLSLGDIPRLEQLSGKFGLGRLPAAPPRSQSGLFALALRPVEFTANPTGAYPTSITGHRTVEDGDIIEATAVVLVPWPDEGSGNDLDARRGAAARSIFVEQSGRGLSTNLLPLAMIALNRNTLVWIDVAMLRRELGSDRADLPGLGQLARAFEFSHAAPAQGQQAAALLLRPLAVLAQWHQQGFSATEPGAALRVDACDLGGNLLAAFVQLFRLPQEAVTAGQKQAGLALCQGGDIGVAGGKTG